MVVFLYTCSPSRQPIALFSYNISFVQVYEESENKLCFSVTKFMKSKQSQRRTVKLHCLIYDCFLARSSGHVITNCKGFKTYLQCLYAIKSIANVYLFLYYRYVNIDVDDMNMVTGPRIEEKTLALM
jgi:hypothetical protein